jgi:hypothetical protein
LLSELATELGLVIDKTEQDGDKTASTAAASVTAEKSEQPVENDDPVVIAVRKAVEDATADLRNELTSTQTRLRELLENTPEGTAPGAVSKSEMDEKERREFEEEFKKMSPQEQIRFALAVKHGK